MSVEHEQRHTRRTPCPVCGGGDDMPRGRGIRCAGFTGADGEWVRCTRRGEVEGAELDEGCLPPAYKWKRWDGMYRPWTKEPPPTAIRVHRPRGAAQSANSGHSVDGKGNDATPDARHEKTHLREAGTRYFTYNETQRVRRDDYQEADEASGELVWMKRIRPEHLAGAQWRTGEGPEPIARVYRAEDLAHPERYEDTVLLVEGEATADTLRAAGFLAATWRGGAARTAKAISQLVDAFAGRDVVLLPDADKPGREAMRLIGDALAGEVARLQWCDLYPGEGGGRDAEDWLYEHGGDTNAFTDLIEAAPDYKTPADTTSGEGDSEAPAPLAMGPYVVDGGRICRRKHERDGGVSLVPLCNFTAAITEQVTSDNGAETRGELTIAGAHLNGTPFPPARVSLTEYPAMHWPLRAWGAAAVVSAGMGAKDQLREAILLLSPQNVYRTEYTHTGWRTRGGRRMYLHADGAIGADGPVPDIAVHLSDALTPFALPEPPNDDTLCEAVRASLAVLDVAPDAVTAPLLAAAYRAPLCAIEAADTTVALIGSTGAGKSELAALAQQHYGAGFTRRKLPGSWESTPNALGWLLFEAKDALTVIDDFKPGGTQMDAARLHQAADRVIRGVGNGAGRGRMRADGGLRATTPPRGLLLITGEESPRGESLAARMTTVPVDAGAVDFARLSVAQSDGAAGQYAAAMVGYLRWLAPRLDALAATATADRAALRDAARQGANAHARTPDAVATLAYGWQQWLAFAVDAGAITDMERAVLWARVWDALMLVGQAQREHGEREEPTARFFSLLNTALASWQAHIAGPDGQAPSHPHAPEAFGWKVVLRDGNNGSDGGGDEQDMTIAQGRRIGWVDGDHLYLDVQAAHAAASRVAHETNGPVLVPPAILARRLHERKLLRSSETSRFGYAVRKTLEGKRRPVLHFHIEVLSADHDHHDHHDHGEEFPPPPRATPDAGGQSAYDHTGAKHDHGGHITPPNGHTGNDVRGEEGSDSGGSGHAGHTGHAVGTPYTSQYTDMPDAFDFAAFGFREGDGDA